MIRKTLKCNHECIYKKYINRRLVSNKPINNSMSANHHNTLKATYSYKNTGFEHDVNNNKSQYRRAISYDGYYTLNEEESSEGKSATITPSIGHIAIPIAETSASITHREIKTGRQRFRWNILFNVLVWIICPLPLWLPFVSNNLAIYILPSIQSIFVLIWLIISILAVRNAMTLYRFV